MSICIDCKRRGSSACQMLKTLRTHTVRLQLSGTHSHALNCMKWKIVMKAALFTVRLKCLCCRHFLAGISSEQLPPSRLLSPTPLQQLSDSVCGQLETSLSVLTCELWKAGSMHLPACAHALAPCSSDACLTLSTFAVNFRCQISLSDQHSVCCSIDFSSCKQNARVLEYI